MPIKLPKLPDREPVKVILSLSPHLHRAIAEYSEIYRETYAEEAAEPVGEIIQYIVQDYLDHDKGFARERRKRAEAGAARAMPREAGNGHAKK